MPTDRTPVLFVHGLWLHPDSWRPWIDLRVASIALRNPESDETAVCGRAGRGHVLLHRMAGARLGDIWVIGALAVGILGLVGFVANEARSTHPMLPLEVFRSRTFSATNVVTFLDAALAGVVTGPPLHPDLVREE